MKMLKVVPKKKRLRNKERDHPDKVFHSDLDVLCNHACDNTVSTAQRF